MCACASKAADIFLRSMTLLNGKIAEVMCTLVAHISLWPATGTPDQCMSLVGYDRPPLQAQSIYIPYKDAYKDITFDGGLLKVGVYWSLVAESRHIWPQWQQWRMKNISFDLSELRFTKGKWAFFRRSSHLEVTRAPFQFRAVEFDRRLRSSSAQPQVKFPSHPPIILTASRYGHN